MFWLTVAAMIALGGVFGVYVYAERQIDRANDLRYASYLLADQLRQSSDDLSRMARTYVATGDPRYRRYHQDILDIRDGRKPRPEGYMSAYWDLVLTGELPPPGDGQASSLLDLMRQLGFSADELYRLAVAKKNSDALTVIEFSAMKLVEDSSGPDAAANRAKALSMMHDARYHSGKAAIMRPINEFYDLLDRRTADQVQMALSRATAYRYAFILLAVLVVLMLWRTFAAFRRTLGGSAAELHKHIARLGQGDFSCPIEVAPAMKGSVLADLSSMQTRLKAIEAERQRAEEQQRIAATAFESQEGMVVTDTNGVILRVNRAFCDISGYAVEELVGQNPRMLKSGRHNADFYRDMWASIQREGGWRGEIWDRRKNGQEYPKWLTISAVKNGDGAVTHYVGVHYDITERKKAEERINELAFFDQLTGLPNRTLLLDRLNQVRAASSRSGSHGALFMIDLDHFKTLNDTRGHDMGDLLLKQVAQRLAASVREEDTVARLGGDEFVVLLASLSRIETEAAAQSEIVGEKIRSALNQMYQLNNVAFHGSASIGVTLFSGHTATIDDLMKQADLAMYKSKEAGRNALHFFDPHMETVVQERAALERDLRQAIQEQQFLLYYQAQVAGEGRPTGVEALVRWRHPQRGIVSPAEFIPLAEETGLILPLGSWVLETACNRLAIWASRPAMAHLTIAVNVSAHQLHQNDFVQQVLAVLKKTGANPQRLKLELTESLLVENVHEIIEKMHALKAVGVGFSLDDFGTGYSSLSYLKLMPLDQLKIDQSFVRDVLSDPDDASIAKTVIALADALGLGVVAEGVETAAQRDFLASCGCHAYQGYFFARPLPIDEFERFAQQV